MKLRTFYQKLPLYKKKNYPPFIKNYRWPPEKKLKPLISHFIKNSIFGDNRDPCSALLWQQTIQNIDPDLNITAPRLPIAASQSQTSGDGGDCYYLLMRDRERTARMVQQLVDTLQQVNLILHNFEMCTELFFNGDKQPGCACNSNTCDLDDQGGRLSAHWPG